MLQVHEEDKEFDSAPGALVELVQKLHKELRQVLIHVRRGRSGYVATGKYFNIITPAELEQTERGAPREWESPETIAAQAWQLAVRHAREFGSSHYKFLLNDLDGKKLDEVICPVSESGSEDREDPKRERESETVDVIRLAKQIANDSHRNYMEVFREARSMLGTLKDYAKQQTDAEVTLINRQYDLQDRKVDLEEERVTAEASARKWEAAMSPFAAVTAEVGRQVGDRIKFWLMWLEEQVSANGGEPPPSSFGVALDEVLAGINLDGVERACREVDEELWTLLGELRGIQDNDAFRNVAGNFKRRALAAMSRGKKPQTIMDELEKALPVDRFKRLVVLLKHSGAL